MALMISIMRLMCILVKLNIRSIDDLPFTFKWSIDFLKGKKESSIFYKIRCIFVFSDTDS